MWAKDRSFSRLSQANISSEEKNQEIPERCLMLVKGRVSARMLKEEIVSFTLGWGLKKEMWYSIFFVLVNFSLRCWTLTCKLLVNGKTQIHNKRLLTSLQRSKHLLKENLSKTSVSDRSWIKLEGEGERPFGTNKGYITSNERNHKIHDE